MKSSKKRIRKPSEIVESLSAAASRLGIELHHVQAAKKAGCIAFKPGGRVHLVELKDHFDKNPVSKAFLPPLTDEELAAQSGIEDSLAGAIRDELELDRELQHARSRGNSADVANLILAVSRARKARLAIEAAVTKLKQARGELLTLDSWKMELHRIYSPVVTVLRQIPRRAAEALRPDVDEIRVEKAVAEIVEAALAQVKSIVKPSSTDEQSWAASQLLVVISGPDRKINSQSLELVDSLRAFVVSELAKQAGETAPIEPEKPPITSEF